jgi:hypothetical protein
LVRALIQNIGDRGKRTRGKNVMSRNREQLRIDVHTPRALNADERDHAEDERDRPMSAIKTPVRRAHLQWLQTVASVGCAVTATCWMRDVTEPTAETGASAVVGVRYGRRDS